MKVKYRELFQPGNAVFAVKILQMLALHRHQSAVFGENMAGEQAGMTWQALPDNIAEDTLPPGF